MGSVVRRAIPDASRFFPRPSICICHRRSRDRVDATLRRCQRKRCPDWKSTPRWRQSSRWLIVKNRLPCSSVIGCFENATIDLRHVKDIRLGRNAADRAGSPAAERSDVAPAQNRIELSRARLPNPHYDGKNNYDCISNRSHKPPLWSADQTGAMCVRLSSFSEFFLNPDRDAVASNRKKGIRILMDSMPAPCKRWKVRLTAFGIGIIVAAAIFGIALVISDDLRLLYLSGGSLLAVAAFLLTAKAREDWIVAVLLLFASTFLFALFVLHQTPLLWPTLLLWVAIVSLLLFRNRFGKMIRIGGAVTLVAVSAWYCLLYIPLEMQRALTHVSNSRAPVFTLQPISQNPGPTSATAGKILVLDFFATWCSPCIAELPELERLPPSYRRTVTLNSCSSARTRAAIRLSGCEPLHSNVTFQCRSRLIPNRQRCTHLV